MKTYQFINRRNILLTCCFALSLSLAGCGERADVASRLAQQAEQQMQEGRLDLAQKTIIKAIQERDDIADIYVLRGRIELAAKQPGKALDAYSDALALDKTNAEALQAAAQLGLQVGRFQVAEDAANRILAVNPEDTNALLVLGLLRIVGHNYDKALEYSDRILKRTPTNEAANILKTRALYLLGKADEAFKHITSVVPANGPTEGESLTLLELYRERYDSKEMLNQFAYLRKLRPDDFVLRTDEANLRYKLGDMSGARALTGQALLRATEDLSQAVSAVSLLREYDRAPFDDIQLKALAAKAPPSALVELARYYIDIGQPQKVAVIFGDSQNADAKAMSARAAIKLGNQNAGLAMAEDVLKKDKSHCDATLARAEFKLLNKRADDAILDAQNAQTQCPKIASGWLILAKAYMAKTDPAGTRRIFDQAIAAMPQDRMIGEDFARWLISQKQSERAATAVHRLTRASPALTSGWLLYQNICQQIGDTACLSEANSGLAEAKRTYAIDPVSGERPAVGLFGRMRKI